MMSKNKTPESGEHDLHPLCPWRVDPGGLEKKQKRRQEEHGKKELEPHGGCSQVGELLDGGDVADSQGQEPRRRGQGREKDGHDQTVKNMRQGIPSVGIFLKDVPVQKGEYMDDVGQNQGHNQGGDDGGDIVQGDSGQGEQPHG